MSPMGHQLTLLTGRKTPPSPPSLVRSTCSLPRLIHRQTTSFVMDLLFKCYSSRTANKPMYLTKAGPDSSNSYKRLKGRSLLQPGQEDVSFVHREWSATL